MDAHQVKAVLSRLSTFNAEIAILSLAVVAGVAFWLTLGTQSSRKAGSILSPYTQFAYNNFIKPHDVKAGEGQQHALESFYARQAGIYDTTRKRLLCGREDMLAMVAAQVQSRSSRTEKSQRHRKPVWYDIGGGTGHNIEAMDRIANIENTFEQVFLVDYSPSLCAVARERVQRCGWKNVTIICDDARRIQCPQGSADLVTMSYSLSMIPDFYSVVDLLTGFLSADGIIGIVDFYVQSLVDVSSRTYIGGTFNRHVNWFGRMFWRTWFEADRVNLDAGRRDYVEYRFGTILSCSERNYWLGGIPYYKFIGCRRDADTSARLIEQEDAVLTESPYLSANEYRKHQNTQQNTEVVHSKSYESAIVNLSSNLPLPAAFYQKHSWRICYNELLEKHQQFKNEYIYAFNWEDPTVDRQLLNINSSDVILTITSAGDNILDYMLEAPRRIHAVDLNPNQNHLLELKIAAFTCLPHADVWQLFGEGRHPDFRALLISKLSPHLSSVAFQYWLENASVFASKHGLYETGGSRHAIQLMRRLFRFFNMTSKVQTICSVETMNEQREMWPQIRDVLLSWPLHKLVVSTEWWAWKAAGVPKEQRDLILDDFSERSGRPRSQKDCGEAIWEYMVDTLDPVIEKTQLSRENYFYYVCLLGRYSKKCRPRYLDQKHHARLSRPGAFDGLRIHTDELMEVISRITPSTLTIAILMDSMDWFDPTDPSGAAASQVLALNKVLKIGGRVFFRSAARKPWYTDLFAEHGFEPKRVGLREGGRCIDRVNMYASTWICTKVMNVSIGSSDTIVASGPAGSLEEIEI